MKQVQIIIRLSNRRFSSISPSQRANEEEIKKNVEIAAEFISPTYLKSHFSVSTHTKS